MRDRRLNGSGRMAGIGSSTAGITGAGCFEVSRSEAAYASVRIERLHKLHPLTRETLFSKLGAAANVPQDVGKCCHRLNLRR